MEVGLRPVAPDDEPFLLAVYASTRASELEQVPWTHEQKTAFVAQQFGAQSQHYARHYSAMSADVVVVDGKPAGRLLVARGGSELRIVDISLLPEFRGRGVGSELIKCLQNEAESAGKSVTIHVEKFNPAFGLYRRLGFREVLDEGVYLMMSWRPA